MDPMGNNIWREYGLQQSRKKNRNVTCHCHCFSLNLCWHPFGDCIIQLYGHSDANINQFRFLGRVKWRTAHFILPD
jgi:hypothetical protein